ncbi:MAG: arylsulfatase [Planctomycetes bacterium]|nr:arylsulfatase [Planctomycetota bacterium]
MTRSTHTRRHFLKTASLHAALLAVPGCANLQWPSSRGPDRPNIVLIMADDMGYSDIGCYGSEIKTPNLDRLAANGLRFTQFYNTARCCPTRACLLTGLYPHQAGVGHMMNDRGLDGYRGDLNNSCVTIAEALKTSGYATYMSGKWHITRQTGHWTGNKNLTSKHNWPCQRGFDHFYGIIHGAASFFDPVTLTRDNEPIEPESENYYFTDAISDNASTFITDHTETKTNAPFFCYVAYTAPHWPLHALPEDIERYKGRYDKGWDALRAERHQRMIRMGIVNKRWKLTQRDKNAPTWEDAKNKPWQARRMEVYAAQIDRMDQGIGRIVKTLKKTGQLHNTLIFFIADNGGCAEELRGKGKALHIPKKTRNERPVQVGNNPDLMPGPENTYQSYGLPWANASNTPFRRYKHWVHEGGVASPLIVHWPKQIRHKNQFRKHPAHLIDIMPTSLAAANAPYPSDYKGNPITPLPGVSLLPAFDNKPLNRKAIFFEHEGNRAVRYENWKLVAKGAYGPWELYNLTKDRTETYDLTSAYPGKTLQLAKMWNDWAQRSNVLPWPWKKPMKNG